MPSQKTAEEHQANSRLGALAESLTQTFLLEYCDFCFPCQEKHPADLICELGSAKYTVQVKARNVSPEGKYVFATENSRNQSQIYKHYHYDIIAFVFMPNKRIFFKPNTSSQTYFTFDKKIITPTLEIDTFKETLDSLSSVPIIRPIFLKEAD
jgi:hypothetical protein